MYTPGIPSRALVWIFQIIPQTAHAFHVSIHNASPCSARVFEHDLFLNILQIRINQLFLTFRAREQQLHLILRLYKLKHTRARVWLIKHHRHWFYTLAARIRTNKQTPRVPNISSGIERQNYPTAQQRVTVERAGKRVKQRAHAETPRADRLFGKEERASAPLARRMTSLQQRGGPVLGFICGARARAVPRRLANSLSPPPATAAVRLFCRSLVPALRCNHVYGGSRGVGGNFARVYARAVCLGKIKVSTLKQWNSFGKSMKINWKW